LQQSFAFAQVWQRMWRMQKSWAKWQQHWLVMVAA
jgi:hypothetical protein